MQSLCRNRSPALETPQADELGVGREKHQTSTEHDGAEGHAHVPLAPERWESPNRAPWGAADPWRTARCGYCPASPGLPSGTSSAAATGSPAAGEKHKPAELSGPGRAELTPTPQGCRLWRWHSPCRGFKGTARLLTLSLKGPLYNAALPLTRGPQMCRHLCRGRVNGTGEGAASTPHTAGHYQRPSSAWPGSTSSLQGPDSSPCSSSPPRSCRQSGERRARGTPQTELPPALPSRQLTITLQDFPLRSLPSPGG